MLSMACKAGKVKSGEFAVEKAVKENKAFLVIVASDASSATKEAYLVMCKNRNIPIVEYSSKTGLGKSIGKEFRAAVAVCDKGFSENIAERMNSYPRI